MMFFILAIFDEKHVTTILFENRENIFVSSSLTSFSDLEVPGTLALVESPIKAKQMASLINSISSGLISGRAAKEVFEIMKETGGEPVKIIDEKGLKQKSDPKELEGIIDKVISENKDKVEQYKSGKDKLFGFFVGQIMKASGGKANPQLVNNILKNKLK